MADLLKLNTENFETEVEKSNMPVVVDFFATWCGPCKAIAPVLDEFAKEYAGKVKIAKVDVDEAGSLAAKFNVRGVPTLLFFKDGKVNSQLVGAQPKDKLKGEIDKLL